MEEKFDLIVFGSGSAGQHVASEAAEAGWRVAIIETRPPGGTCSNRGCDAKKPFVNLAAVVDASERLRRHGLVSEQSIDWSSAQAFKRHFTDAIPERTREKLRGLDIALFEGEARFIDQTRLRFAETILEAKHYLIATGLRPRRLDFPGAQYALDSDAFLDLKELPPRIAFIGGGYISTEFSHAARRAGAACTLIERNSCILAHFDADLCHAAAQITRACGIELQLDSCVTEITEQENGSFQLSCEETGWSMEADLVVHGAGRELSFDAESLEAGGIDWNERGIVVDEALRSISNTRVFACGDAAATPGAKLTPVAGLESKAVAQAILHGRPQTIDYRATASVVFSSPPIASVGPSEAQARDAGLDIVVKRGDASEWKFYQQLGVAHAFYKTIVERESKRILAAHLAGPGAEEVINLFALAIKNELQVPDFKSVLFAYPTLSSHAKSML